MPCPESKILASLVSETLDDASVEEIERHLIDCKICSNKVAELEQELSTGISIFEILRKVFQNEKLRKVFPNDDIFQYFRPDEDFLPDEVKIAGFKNIRKIGAGGMGVVYEAEEIPTGELRAVKILKCNSDSSLIPLIQRFQREKEALSKLDHDNIVKSYPSDDPHCIVMELLLGLPLDKYVKKNKPISEELAKKIITQAAQGLQYAHGKGIVHRDIKPENLFITDDGTVKIIDFGLVRIPDTESLNHALTQPGDFLGTYDYVSPEQIRHTHYIDAKSDIYSLGCTFFYLLSGEVLFPGAREAKLVGHFIDTAPPIQKYRPDIKPALASVLAKMLEKNPADRYQSMEEVIAAIKSKKVERPKRKPANWSLPISIFASVTLSVLIVGLILFFTNIQEQQGKTITPPSNPQPSVPDVVPNAAVSDTVVSTPAVSNVVVSDWGKNRTNVMPPRVFPCSISPNFSPGGLRVKSRVNDENVSNIEYSFDGETWQKAMNIQKGSAPPFVKEFYDFFVKNSADAEKIYVRYFDDKGNQSETFETQYNGKRFENIPPPITGNPKTEIKQGPTGKFYNSPNDL